MKPTSWFELWKRLGKQPLNKTRGQYVKCCIIGQMWYCQLVYKNNGSDFYLVPVRLVPDGKEHQNETKKETICSCWVEYPNPTHKMKNGKWKCVDYYECIYTNEQARNRCTTKCRMKEGYTKNGKRVEV